MNTLIISLAIITIIILLVFLIMKFASLSENLRRVEAAFKEDMRFLTSEIQNIGKENRGELSNSLKEFSSQITLNIKAFQESSDKSLALLWRYKEALGRCKLLRRTLVG